jgi:hypothetical protein
MIQFLQLILRAGLVISSGREVLSLVHAWTLLPEPHYSPTGFSGDDKACALKYVNKVLRLELKAGKCKLRALKPLRPCSSKKLQCSSIFEKRRVMLRGQQQEKACTTHEQQSSPFIRLRTNGIKCANSPNISTYNVAIRKTKISTTNLAYWRKLLQESNGKVQDESLLSRAQPRSRRV